MRWVKDKEFEFQCLHGMGETLYDQLLVIIIWVVECVFMPVGTHKRYWPFGTPLARKWATPLC